MPEPSRNPRRKWLTALCWAAVFTLLIAVTLPLQVEHFFLPRLLDKAGLAGYRVAISRFGLRGCTMHLASAPENAFLRAGTLRLDWTVADLLSGRLRQMTGDGMLINLARPSPIPSSKKTVGDDARDLPLLIDQIELRNSFIVLPRNGSSFLLPLSFSGQQQEKQATSPNDELQYRLTLHAASQSLNAELTFNRKGLFTCTGKTSLDLPSLAVTLPMPGNAVYQGSARLALEFAGALLPFRLDKISGSALLNDFEARWGDALLRSSGNNEGRLTFSGDSEGYRINGSDFTLAEPMTAGLAFDSEIFPENNAIRWQGSVSLQPAQGQQLADQVFFEKFPALSLRHDGKAGGGRLEVNLKAGPQEGQQQNLYVFRLRNYSFQAEGLTAEAQAILSPESESQRLTATFALKSGLVTNFANGEGRVPVVALQGSAILLPRSSNQVLAVRGRLDLNDGELKFASQELRLQAMNLSLPFSWPGEEQTSPGKLEIKNISLGQTPLGSFSGTITQENNLFSLQGQARNTLLPENSINIAANVQPLRPEGPLAEASWSVDQARLAAEKLAQLHPALKSLTGSANLDLAGFMRFDQCGLQGELAANLQGGDFALPEAQLNLDDVTLNLRLPRLPELETSPAQNLAIGSIRSKKFAITDLHTAFRVESPQSLFIENISGKWSGGRIFSNSIRLYQDLRKLEIAIICDRLQLAQILTQLGLAEAEGEGVLSGRIPLVYSDRGIRVDDGFLFTSPGAKGTLKIIRSNHLNIGLPLDAPQFSPLHFAGAALGDFEYNWARLNILSEEENLLLKLQIDGKPRERLPYRFDAQNNVFVRLPAGAVGGIDQPVKLDVNFRVPVDELLRNQQILLPLLRNLK